MKKSKRLKAVGPLTREEFEIVIERVAIHTTKLRALEAQRDQAIQAVQQAFALRLTAHESIIKADVALCEKFAEEHRAELITGKAKSNETPLARYGFRTGNRTVALLNKKCSWEVAVKLLKTFDHLECVRVVEEVNKDAVLAGTDEKGLLGVGTGDQRENVIDLATIGLKIKQAETFFIEPKVDGADLVKGGAS